MTQSLPNHDPRPTSPVRSLTVFAYARNLMERPKPSAHQPLHPSLSASPYLHPHLSTPRIFTRINPCPSPNPNPWPTFHENVGDRNLHPNPNPKWSISYCFLTLTLTQAQEDDLTVAGILSSATMPGVQDICRYGQNKLFNECAKDPHKRSTLRAIVNKAYAEP